MVFFYEYQVIKDWIQGEPEAAIASGIVYIEDVDSPLNVSRLEETINQSVLKKWSKEALKRGRLLSIERV
jgi:hypothetical protein